MTLHTYIFFACLFGCMAMILVQARVFYNRTYPSMIIGWAVLGISLVLTVFAANVDPMATLPYTGREMAMCAAMTILGLVFMILAGTSTWCKTEQKFLSNLIPFPTCIGCAFIATISYPIAAWLILMI